MRILLYLGCAGLSLFAQQAPVGIVRGDLVQWQGAANTGQLSLKTLEGRVYECSFDGKTYFERDNQRVAPAVMTVGDRLELLSDRRPGSQVCYARTVRVMDPTSANLSVAARQRFRRPQSPTESFAPRGDMTFAGVVVKIDTDAMVLRTRTDGEKLIVLRHDTRYIGDGQRADLDHLERNTRVFVRAGRNLENEIEAYQVVWGRIVQPN
jgi:hypothetical protein